MIYTKKVDFHSHFLSKTYYEYLEKYEGSLPDGFPTPEWDEKGHLALMDKLGVAFSLISVSSPNLSKADEETEIDYVHKINLEGAEFAKKHPDRIGLLASLPLPHTQAAVREARFATEELGAYGFGLSTHYAGVYLGDERYDPLMEYLDGIGALVTVHPVEPAAVHKGVNDELPIPAMEFLFDTTRTFTNMVLHDIFGRYPNIKWVFPHAGAFISVLSDRMAGFAMQFGENLEKPVPLDFKGDMRHVYFDLAGFPVNKQIHDLLLDVGTENLVYGSDAPYTPKIACIAQTGLLEKTVELSDGEKNEAFTLNAVKIVPRLSEILNVKADGKTVCYADAPLNSKEKSNRMLRGTIAKLYKKVFG